MNPKTIGFVADHSGFDFKDKIIHMFQSEGYETVDYGCFSNQNCDYSDYIPIACEGIESSEVNIVIASCKSGQGINICANHQRNIISVVPRDFNSLLYARKHNSPNFLSFASDIWDAGVALRLLWMFTQIIILRVVDIQQEFRNFLIYSFGNNKLSKF